LNAVCRALVLRRAIASAGDHLRIAHTLKIADRFGKDPAAFGVLDGLVREFLEVFCMGELEGDQRNGGSE
jgi:hypothetical protein